MAENKHALGTYHQPSWIPHIGSGGVENETDVQVVLLILPLLVYKIFHSIPHCQKSVVYSKEKVYCIYMYIYIYVYQLATVCFLCINKIQSNIANEKLQTTHFCEKRTFDHSNRSCRAPLAVLLLKNLRGRKRCAALPKRCSPQIRKFDLLKNASKNATS